MTAPERSTTDLAPPTRSSGECPACPHPLDDHDDLGRRFCAATTSSALSRACICR
ncbi:RGCVC family protein [Umezawaea beigongshangensis]|uniref:RGCVC family protein n=1 Tax=Umezawaea beigongshangensis TaxID=2780383 RepID=UPI0018F1F94C|nr:RGCVC family protein [Umezawaea beigongshangensis]